MNLKINALRKKVENIEKKIGANNNDGIQEWAINQVEFESSVERNWPFGDESVPLKLQTQEAVIAKAKEISEKYSSLDDYFCDTIDPTPMKKLMEEWEREDRGKKGNLEALESIKKKGEL